MSCQGPFKLKKKTGHLSLETFFKGCSQCHSLPGPYPRNVNVRDAM
jgi:hypothetical protein